MPHSRKVITPSPKLREQWAWLLFAYGLMPFYHGLVWITSDFHSRTFLRYWFSLCFGRKTIDYGFQTVVKHAVALRMTDESLRIILPPKSKQMLAKLMWHESSRRRDLFSRSTLCQDICQRIPSRNVLISSYETYLRLMVSVNTPNFQYSEAFKHKGIPPAATSKLKSGRLVWDGQFIYLMLESLIVILTCLKFFYNQKL